MQHKIGPWLSGITVWSAILWCTLVYWEYILENLGLPNDMKCDTYTWHNLCVFVCLQICNHYTERKYSSHILAKRGLRISEHLISKHHMPPTPTQLLCFPHTSLLTLQDKVILAKYLVTTVVWLSLLWNFMNVVLEKIHAVGTDTCVNFTSLPQNDLQAPHSLN